MPTPDSTNPPLIHEREGAIATLRFNRPKSLNAIDVEMAHALLDAITALHADASVRAIVLAGVGKGFMAGGDLATMRTDPVGGSHALLEPLNQAVNLLAQINAPVIAQVHGVAAGAGISLMLHADFVLAAEDTRFNLAYINLGTSCDVGMSWTLPRLIGTRQALELAMLGETLNTTEAQRIGLINRVMPMTELETETRNLAQRLAAGPTLAYGAMKRLMRTSFDRSLPEQLTAEANAFWTSAGTRDFGVGVEAFFAKEKPKFTGT